MISSWRHEDDVMGALEGVRERVYYSMCKTGYARSLMLLTAKWLITSGCQLQAHECYICS
jgi:hypothetical protein